MENPDPNTSARNHSATGPVPVNGPDLLGPQDSPLRAFLDSLATGIILYDLQGRAVYCNDSAASILALSKSAILAAPLHDPSWHLTDTSGRRLSHSEYPATRCLEQGVQINHQIVSMIRGDGAKIWLSVFAQPLILPGQSRHFLAVVSIQDITAQRRNEDALRLSEERYRIIAEQTGQLIYEYEFPSGDILWFGAIQPVTGYTPDEFRSMNVERWRNAIHPDDRALALKALEHVIHYGGRYEVEYRFQRKDGTYVHIEDYGVFLRDERGTPTVMLGTISDITHRRQQERLRQELEAQLRQSQKMEAIGTLAGGIAHNFNNILSAIMGFSELARMEAQNHPSIQHHIDQVLKAAERARDLVRQILTFSRRQPPDLRPIDLTACVQDAVRLLRATLPPSIQIHTHIDGPIHIRGDTAQIEQVLINLGTNAAHAIGSVDQAAGGRITISLRSLEIARGHAPEGFPPLTPGPYADLQVEDTGCGMDEATLKRIFEPFFTTKPTGQGPGLGLSTVHGIIYDHSGAIVASSQHGQGTRFRILLPATVDAPELPASPLAGSKAAGRGQRILIVDDEPEVCRVMGRIVDMLGYASHIETDSTAALEQVRQGTIQPDLVILDLAMPGLTGIQLATALHTLHPALPIVLLTGYGGDWTPEKAAACGICRVAAKPISASRLAALIQEVLASPAPGPV
jgi:PAS domain S-box-containing protein